MKKARVFSGLLAVLMIIGLCACSNDNTNSVSSSPENTSTADESGGQRRFQPFGSRTFTLAAMNKRQRSARRSTNMQKA